MNVYLIRHGKSDDAESGLSQRKEAGLSSSGKSDVLSLKTEFNKIPFDKIYYSPWNRAKDTAKLLFDDKKVPSEEISYLHEYKKPSHLEGQDRSITEKYWNDNLDNIFKPDWKPEDGESFNDILRRVGKLRNLILQHKENEIIGVVSHGIAFRHLIGSWLMGKEYDQSIYSNLLRHIHLDNLGYILIDVNKDKNTISIRRWHNWF